MPETHSCLAGYDVAQATPEKAFKILFSSFLDKQKTFCDRKTVVSETPYPSSIMQSGISHGELLGIISEYTPTAEEKSSSYHEQNIDERDTSPIEEHLADMREAHMASDESPSTAEAINLDVEEKYHSTIRTMLKKHESMWNGELSGINVIKRYIDFVPASLRFNSQLYRAVSKTREMEQLEIQK